MATGAAPGTIQRHPFEPMPLIPASFTASVFYLYSSADDAVAGERNGGTGFLVSVQDAAPSPPTFYAVSNRHIVEPPPLGNATVARVNAPDGSFNTLSDLIWKGHPDGDDLAIARVGLGDTHVALSAVDGTLVLPQAEPGSADEQAAMTLWGPGNEVFFVGRNADHEGKETNTVTVRFGNIAMMPDDRERIRNPDLQIDQESYVVDSRSIGGFSGSPVFVNNQSFITNEGRWDFYMAGRTHLLGVIWGHHERLAAVLGSDKKRAWTKEELWTAQNSGLVYVVPSWKLHNMLFDEEEVATRRNPPRNQG